MRLMAERSAAFGDEELPPSRHQLIVHAGADLVGRLMEALLDEDAGPEAIDQITLGPDDLCETDEGVVVTVNTVLLALLTGTVRGILYDPQGEILRFGRNRRIFTPAQAQALRARFRRCLHPYGCDRTGQWLESDHEPEYQDGGRTDIEHGRVACHVHNVWKTNTKNRPPPVGDTSSDAGRRRAPPRFPQYV
jgi:hypothetical protein